MRDLASPAIRVSELGPGCLNTSGDVCAVDNPSEASVYADSLAFCSRLEAICCIKKNPSSEMTAAEVTKVVLTTRSCSELRHRKRSLRSSAIPLAVIPAANRVMA